jgi:anti-anti-sigma factor
MAGDDLEISVDVGTDLTVATAGQLRSAVAEALLEARTVLLQLGSVVSYDGAGLGLLIGLRRRIGAAGGRLICLNPPPALHAGIRKLGLHRVLDIRIDVPEQRTAADAGLPPSFGE